LRGDKFFCQIELEVELESEKKREDRKEEHKNFESISLKIVEIT